MEVRSSLGGKKRGRGGEGERKERWGERKAARERIGGMGGRGVGRQ